MPGMLVFLGVHRVVYAGYVVSLLYWVVYAGYTPPCVYASLHTLGIPTILPSMLASVAVSAGVDDAQ